MDVHERSESRKGFGLSAVRHFNAWLHPTPYGK
jgi:hypothetical protein